MRYVDLSQLKEGMVLAQHFYGSKFEILLAEGMTLTDYHIQRIHELGYAGVYILDDISTGIEVRNIIPPELRLETIKAAKDIWQQVENDQIKKGRAKVTKERQQKIIMPVIEALIGNNYRIVDRIDLKPYEYYTYYHAANVVALSLLVGLELGVSGAQLYDMGLAALLYDIGSSFTPEAILKKPGKLTFEEYEIVKEHTNKGFSFLYENFDISIDACLGAQQHHEHYDGSGYPSGLKKSKISLVARVIAITDVFDALTSRRPFREPMFPADAIAYMDSKAGTIFDPDILDVFKKVAAPYPSGLCVELNSGVRCIVTDNFRGSPNRPRLRLLTNTPATAQIVDLHGDPKYHRMHISKIISAD